jgi:uncharacterized protein (TIGR03083 family)
MAPDLVVPVPELRRTVDDLSSAWEAFAAMIEPLAEQEWTKDTRCEGWEVRDVAGHVTGMTTQAASGEPTSDPDQQAIAFRHLEPAAMAAALRNAATRLGPSLHDLTQQQWEAPFGDRFPTLGEAIQTLLHDTHIHGDDVAVAITGRPWEGPGLWAAVNTVTVRLHRRGWSGPTIVIDDKRVLAAATPTQGTVCTEPRDFVLAATGRLAPGVLGLDDQVNIYLPPRRDVGFPGTVEAH